MNQIEKVTITREYGDGFRYCAEIVCSNRIRSCRTWTFTYLGARLWVWYRARKILKMPIQDKVVYSWPPEKK